MQALFENRRWSISIDEEQDLLSAPHFCRVLHCLEQSYRVRLLT